MCVCVREREREGGREGESVCVCVCVWARVRARAPACARTHMVGLDETTKEIKHLEAISTFSPVGSRSSDGMKMRAANESARACVCTE